MAFFWISQPSVHLFQKFAPGAFFAFHRHDTNIVNYNLFTNFPSRGCGDRSTYVPIFPLAQGRLQWTEIIEYDRNSQCVESIEGNLWWGQYAMLVMFLVRSSFIRGLDGF